MNSNSCRAAASAIWLRFSRFRILTSLISSVKKHQGTDWGIWWTNLQLLELEYTTRYSGDKLDVIPTLTPHANDALVKEYKLLLDQHILRHQQTWDFKLEVDLEEGKSRPKGQSEMNRFHRASAMINRSKSSNELLTLNHAMSAIVSWLPKKEIASYSLPTDLSRCCHHKYLVWPILNTKELPHRIGAKRPTLLV